MRFGLRSFLNPKYFKNRLFVALYLMGFFQVGWSGGCCVEEVLTSVRLLSLSIPRLSPFCSNWAPSDVLDEFGSLACFIFRGLRGSTPLFCQLGLIDRVSSDRPRTILCSTVNSSYHFDSLDRFYLLLVAPFVSLRSIHGFANFQTHLDLSLFSRNLRDIL